MKFGNGGISSDPTENGNCDEILNLGLDPTKISTDDTNVYTSFNKLVDNCLFSILAGSDTGHIYL